MSITPDLADHRVVITAAGRDFGRTLAIRLEDLGAEVYLSTRNQAAAERVRKEVRHCGHERLHIFTCDLTNPETITCSPVPSPTGPTRSTSCSTTARATCTVRSRPGAGRRRPEHPGSPGPADHTGTRLRTMPRPVDSPRGQEQHRQRKEIVHVRAGEHADGSGRRPGQISHSFAPYGRTSHKERKTVTHRGLRMSSAAGPRLAFDRRPRP